MENKAYLGSIQLNNYTSFVGENYFDLRDEKGNIYQWTVILGNNNTGKTNFLKAIAGLEIFAPNNHNHSGILNLPITHKNETNVDFLFYKSLGNISKNQFNTSAKNNDFCGQIQSKYSSQTNSFLNTGLVNREILGYGVSRRSGETSFSSSKIKYNSETLFESNKTLINIEEWLLQLDYANKNKDKTAENQLVKLKELIKSEIFPEINNIRFISESTESYVEFQTIEGWFKLKELGYGYQTTLSWIFDLSKKLFTLYPDSKNPLKEPSIVLVDELDLHLHPKWQRQIIKYLSDIFTQTQFIVTTHSPFIIQSIEKINLFILIKNKNKIEVSRPSFKTFKGWSIEEILDEILGLEEKTKSDKYLALIKQFDKALDLDNYEQALIAYNQLIKILHPTSSERKLLKIQLSQLIQND